MSQINSAACLGQKFGHQFPYTGADCMRCGVNQTTLRPRRSKPFQDEGLDPETAQRTMHSETHALVRDIALWTGEPKNFGMFLGVVTRIGKDQAYKIFSELKDFAKRKRIKNKAALFMNRTRGSKDIHRSSGGLDGIV